MHTESAKNVKHEFLIIAHITYCRLRMFFSERCALLCFYMSFKRLPEGINGRPCGRQSIHLKTHKKKAPTTSELVITQVQMMEES